MKEYLGFIATLITILYLIKDVYIWCFKHIKLLVPKFYKSTKRTTKYFFIIQYRYFIQTTRQAINFIEVVVNHPFYSKLGITVNALFLLTCGIYGALLFAVKVNEGHSIFLLLICLTIFLAASINFFYQSIKLYK